MYITNKDFETIEKALSVLYGDVFNSLSDVEQEKVTNADMVLTKLLRKKKSDNERQKKFMEDKRKTDKFYGRKLYVHKDGSLGYK